MRVLVFEKCISVAFFGRWITICLSLIPCTAIATDIDFARDIAPILARHCYECHGPDASTRKADLRLDQLAPLVRDNVSKAMIRPGSPEGSHLWERVTASDESRMPPAKHSKALTENELASIRAWIIAGAAVSKHWAFVPPHRPAIPEVKENRWPQNPIDYFVLEKLEKHGLAPSPRAQEGTLLRRLAFDTTGLPPTLNEMKEFKHSSGKWEKWIDHFISKKSYGEHQAVNWLDAARYADTSGHAADKPREMWMFRDWVIEAFNQNMPYDQFTIEQLAGDMFAVPTDSQLIATGFHRNSMQALGNNPRKEEFRVKGIVDRLETTGKVWLGLTLGCAECHDHKYDPISQKEYYELYAVFNNIPHLGERFEVHGPLVRLQSAETKQLIEDKELQLARLKANADNGSANNTREMLAYLDKDLNEARTGYSLQSPAFTLNELTLAGTQSYLVSTDKTPKLTSDFSIGMWIKTKQPEVDLVSKYDWKSQRRSYVFGIGGQKDQGSKPGQLYVWFSQNQHPFRGAVLNGSIPVNDGNWHHVAVSYDAGKTLRLYVDGQWDEDAELTGELVKTIADSPLPLSIGGGYDNSDRPNKFFLNGQLKDLRIFDRPLTGLQLGGLSDLKREQFRTQIAAGEFSKELLSYYAHLKESFIDERTRQIQILEKSREALSGQVVDVPVMEELPEPRETYIHLRGDFENPGARVYPGVPEVLLHADEQPVNRLTFAQGLVNGKNPLVARVAVNRIWQQYFGRGIVATADDFGMRGEYPSHPELLDWLAVEFMECGWDMKHIHRLILGSAVYQQSSVRTEVHDSVDPENQWLSRATRFRLSAEQIYDLAAFASGFWDGSVGGKSVYPMQPEGVGQFRDATAGTWQPSSGEDLHRRAIYTYWQRMSPFPLFVLLDVPSRERCVITRSSTNTPLQALALLNDSNMKLYGQEIANRIESQTQTADEQIRLAFRLILSRDPDRRELQAFSSYMESCPKAPLYETVRVLLNLDEALTRE